MTTIAANLIDYSGLWRAYAPWWINASIKQHGGLWVKHWDHSVRERDIDETTGHGVTETTLTAADLRAARKLAAADGALCCDLSMPCAEDADQILQRAVYGRTYYG